MARRQLDQPGPAAGEQRIVGHDKCAGALCGQAVKCGLELALGVCIEHHHVLADLAGGVVQLVYGRYGVDVVGVDQQRDHWCWRNEFAQHLQPLRP